MRKLMIAAALAAATATTTGPAFAQEIGNSQGLIAVNISDVTILNNFLNETQIAALNNVGPITVQAPISVAAAVCDTTVAVLSAQRKDDSPATCNATSGSQALADVVARQKLKQNKK